MKMEPTWVELIVGVIGYVLGWFSRHYGPPRAPGA